MHTTTASTSAVPRIKQGRSRALCAAGAALAAALVWFVEVPLLGIHLNFRFGAGHIQTISIAQVIGVAVAASLLGWLLLAFLERRTPKARVLWTIIALTALAASLALPLAAATTSSAAAGLIVMHVTVGAVVIPAMARTARTRRELIPATLRHTARRLRVAQGDAVGLGYVVGLDGPQPFAEALASLPQQLEGIGGRTLRRAALRVGPVFLDEVGLQGGCDFVDRLQRVVDGPVPCCVVNHAASIAPLRPGQIIRMCLIVTQVWRARVRRKLSSSGVRVSPADAAIRSAT